ncbi:hypothetical protein OIO90_004402 [Microbotryomycetes sp. JL221]|nr:hypothetical protein OIO90_004402 [Microbotryomycetes sp. JL221]
MSDPGELPRELLHLSVLRLVTRSAPFTHAHSVPLHALTHLCAEYLQLIAHGTKQAAEHAGRHKATVWDVGDALDELAPGSWPEMRDQLELADEEPAPNDVDDTNGGATTIKEAERIRQLAHGIRNLLHIEPPPKPIAHLHFGELLPTEIAAVNDMSEPENMPALEHDGLGSPTDSSDSDEPGEVIERREPNSPPAQESEARVIDQVTVVKPGIEEDDNMVDATHNLFLDSWNMEDTAATNDTKRTYVDGDVDGQDERPEEQSEPLSLWRNPEEIPSHVPPFFPPFPGMERESASEAALRRRRERELEAAQAEARAADGRRRLAAARGNPWAAAIPYPSSMLAELHPASALPPVSPPPLAGLETEADKAEREARERQRRPSRRRARSITPPPTRNSLLAFRNTLPEMPHLPTWLRPNSKRRAAASTISLSADLAVASPDSLFGLLPVPATRQATRPPGFLPDYAPSRVHPFNTPLPHTISNPVPSNSSIARVLAPPPHPRIPETLPRLRQHQTGPGSPYLTLFSRTTRMGPPGPLGPKGEALDYEYVGDSAVLALNVEWPIRSHNAKLPTTFATVEDTPGPTAATTPLPATASAAPTPAPVTITLATPVTAQAAASPAATAGTPMGLKLKLARPESQRASPVPEEETSTTLAAEPAVATSGDVQMDPAVLEGVAPVASTEPASAPSEAGLAEGKGSSAELGGGQHATAVNVTQTSVQKQADSQPQALLVNEGPATVEDGKALPEQEGKVKGSLQGPGTVQTQEPAQLTGTSDVTSLDVDMEQPAELTAVPAEEAVQIKPEMDVVDEVVVSAEEPAKQVATAAPSLSQENGTRQESSAPADSAPQSAPEVSASTSRMSSVEASPQPVKLPSFKIRFSSSSLNTSSAPPAAAGATSLPVMSASLAVPGSPAPVTDTAPESASASPAPSLAPRPSLTLKLSPRPKPTASDGT